MKRLLTAAACALAAGCATHDAAIPPTAFRLSAPGMADNAMLERRHAGHLKPHPNCLGDNVSPPLAATNVPWKARSLVLLMDDQAGRAGLGVSHAVIYGIPAHVTHFAEGELSAPPKDGRFVAGRNSAGTSWLGPCPPRGNA